MDLRNVANQVSNTVNANIMVTVRASIGFSIGAGAKQIPSYAPDVTGPANIQALDSVDLKQLDSLNIQGVIRAIFLRGALAGVIRPDSKGGDLVIIPAAAGVPANLVGTWLVVKVLEGWANWTKAAVVFQG